MSVARLTGVLLLFAVVNAVVVHRFGPANSQRRAASAASGSSWFARIVCPLNWSAVTRLQSTFSGVADATAAAAACVLTMTAQGSRETILELNCPDIVAAADLTSALRSNALLPPACTVLVEPNLIVTLAPPAQAQAQAQKRTVTDQPISLAGLWNLDRVDQRNLPLDAHYKSALNGSNVILYHFDTGARLTHTQFGGRATMLIDLVGDGLAPLGDCQGHGTLFLFLNIFSHCFYSKSFCGFLTCCNGELSCDLVAVCRNTELARFAFAVFTPCCKPDPAYSSS
jgi:subtilisin family serine protease